VETGTPWGQAETKSLVRVEVLPELRALGRNQQQQVIVTAVYSDGSRRDVTPLTSFRTNDPAIATVDENGLVTTQSRVGETAIVAIYLNQVGVFRAMVPVPTEEALAESQWPDFPVSNFIDEHVAAKLKQLRVPPSADRKSTR